MMKTPRRSRTLKILGLTLSSALSAVSAMPQTAKADTQKVLLVTERRILAEEVTAAAFSCFIWGDPARGLTSVMNQLYRDIYGQPARVWASRSSTEAEGPCHNGLIRDYSYYANYYVSNSGVFNRRFARRTVGYTLPGRSFFTGMVDGSSEYHEGVTCDQSVGSFLEYSADAIPFASESNRSIYGRLMTESDNAQPVGDPAASGRPLEITVSDSQAHTNPQLVTRNIFPKINFTPVESTERSQLGTPMNPLLFADNLQLEMPSGDDSSRLHFMNNGAVAPFSIDVQAYKSCLQSEMNRISAGRSPDRTIGSRFPGR